jgi:hypothetical protein
MWQWRAPIGKVGKSSSASCVECMREPLGLRMVRGKSETRWLSTGVPALQKVAVQPVSAMAWAEVGVGGAAAGADGGTNLGSKGSERLSDSSGGRWCRPTRQLPFGRRRVCPSALGCLIKFEPRRRSMTVASKSWPSLGWRQVRLVWLL